MYVGPNLKVCHVYVIVRVCICMYVCMHVCMYVCMYECMHICMYDVLKLATIHCFSLSVRHHINSTTFSLHIIFT